jgi:acid phosphatase (class A)
MIAKTARFFAAAVMLALAPAFAADAASYFYIDPAAVDLEHILAPPPADGSAAAKADMDAVLEAQKERTPEDVKAAQADATISLMAFASVMGPGFSEDRLPLATVFFQHAMEDGENAVGIVKKHYQRPRPFAADTRVQPVITIKPSESYPSGHSTFAFIDGILLADMVPEKAAAIFDRATEYAQHRVVAGVHFPSDIQAGRISASVVDFALLRDAKFMADYEKAKAEVRHAIGLE